MIVLLIVLASFDKELTLLTYDPLMCAHFYLIISQIDAGADPLHVARSHTALGYVRTCSSIHATPILSSFIDTLHRLVSTRRSYNITKISNWIARLHLVCRYAEDYEREDLIPILRDAEKKARSQPDEVGP